MPKNSKYYRNLRITKNIIFYQPLNKNHIKSIENGFVDINIMDSLIYKYSNKCSEAYILNFLADSRITVSNIEFILDKLIARLSDDFIIKCISLDIPKGMNEYVLRKVRTQSKKVIDYILYKLKNTITTNFTSGYVWQFYRNNKKNMTDSQLTLAFKVMLKHYIDIYEKSKRGELEALRPIFSLFENMGIKITDEIKGRGINLIEEVKMWDNE